MPWNWELPEWPQFTYKYPKINTLDTKFFKGAGGFAVLKFLDKEQRQEFIVEILSKEGVRSAEIEGEILERESLQSSIRRHFGLQFDRRKEKPQESGMGELMWKMFDTFNQELTHDMLFDWHRSLMGHEKNIDVGTYRTHEDPMQIVSGRLDMHTVYFEAPPSKRLFNEMDAFIDWFNDPHNIESILAKAAIAHVYFESIHPFEDGNGRIGRALVEKVLSQKLGEPTLIAISSQIARDKKAYYKALGQCNKTLTATNWVNYFAETILNAQEEVLKLVQFLVGKAKLMERLKGNINERQEKALLRIFAEGLKGFSGGLSAENYISITKASRATATRDLANLIEKGALKKTGQLRHTRYWLNL